MTLKYNLIEINISEEARHGRQSLAAALVERVRDLKIAARCTVFRGVEAAYENGEVATGRVLDLSYNMPLKVEIILPAAETDVVLPMVEEMITEGMVTVREVAIAVHKTRKRLFPRQIRVKDVMTAGPRIVRPDTPVGEVVEVLLSSIFTGVPVVDDDRRPIGIITQGDLIYRADLPVRLGLLARASEPDARDILSHLTARKAKDIMTSPVVDIGMDELLTNAVGRMLERGVKRLPVLDRDGRLVGMISRLDVFQTITAEAPHWDSMARSRIVVENLRYVSDIMRRDSHKVLPDTPVEDILRLIGSDDIQRVAVTDPEGYFLGLISDVDLLTAFTEQEAGVWRFLVRKMPFTRPKAGHGTIGKTAAEVMRTDIITVREETGLEEAIGLMVDNRLKRLPVLDDQGRFQGMVSRDALLREGFGET